jgi:hypothetical protein
MAPREFAFNVRQGQAEYNRLDAAYNGTGAVNVATRRGTRGARILRRELIVGGLRPMYRYFLRVMIEQ